MKEWFYPTAFSHWGEGEHAAIQRVIASGRFTMGPETEAFEAELADFNRRKHAVVVNSGSSANLIAVAALDARAYASRASRDVWSETKNARVPALAWATTYAPLVQHGYNLVLDDCDDSWCADAGFVIASGVSADQPAHVVDLYVECSILGNPSSSLPLDLADLNDDCESFGATIDGRPTASFGTIATQSFFWSHQLSAIEGGAALTDDEDLADTMRMLRDHGMTRSVRKAMKFEDEYDFRLFGYNVRPVEMHCAIGREQLQMADLRKSARRRNWAHFEALTADLPIVLPVMSDGASPFSLHFRLPTPQIRSVLVSNLRNNGIDCRLPTGGSFRMHDYGQPWANQSTPNADLIHSTGMFLGNAPFDIPDKIEKAVQVMRETFEWLK